MFEDVSGHPNTKLSTSQLMATSLAALSPDGDFGFTTSPAMDKAAAALGLLVCALIALRLAIGPARRQRVDDACRRLYNKLTTRLTRWRHRSRTATKVDPDAARREADLLIERARQRRQDVEQEGNVIRPRAFDPSRKKPPLH